MRWLDRSGDFRPWFAWRPVSIDGEWIWLEWVERRIDQWPSHYYRRVPEKLTVEQARQRFRTLLGPKSE